MAKIIEAATDGRLQIEVHPTGTLLPTPEMFDAISKGVIDMGMAWPGYYSGIEPAFQIFSGLPYGLETLEEYLYCIKELGFEDVLREMSAKHGVYTVDLGVACPYGELSSTVPIKKTDDFKGLKIRSYGLYSRIFEHFGAACVSMASGEIYTGLATGTIDANIWGTPKLHWDLKLHEVAKYWITPPMAAFIGNMVMANPASWNELPDDVKLIVDYIVFEQHLKYPMDTTYLDAGALDDMVTNYGVEICVIPSEETAKMRVVAHQLWDELAEVDEYSAKAIGIMKDFMKLKGYMD